MTIFVLSGVLAAGVTHSHIGIAVTWLTIGVLCGAALISVFACCAADASTVEGE